VCHARLDGNSGERDWLWRIHCHRDLSQVIRGRRSINNTDRSALIELERLVAWSALRLSAANSPPQQTQILALRPALAAQQSPLFTAVVRRFMALAQPDPMDRHSG
jgi:hypothetical protein